MIKIIQAFFLTLFIFGLLGWLYVAAVDLVYPETLNIQLTHLAPWPREDTFGIIYFAVSFIICILISRLNFLEYLDYLE